MYIGEWWNDNWQGKTGILRGKSHPLSLYLPKNTLGLNLVLNGKKTEL